MDRYISKHENDSAVVSQLDLYGQLGIEAESDEFLTEQLITYIGNKRRLLPLIQQAFLRAQDILGAKKLSFADVFAGTGVVSRLARRWSHTLYVNDFEKYSSFSNRVYHTNISEVDLDEINEARREINWIASHKPRAGFITELYAPIDEEKITPADRVFYTRRNAMFIDTARQEISRLPDAIQPFLLAPLIQRASVHVNTSGVFKGFYKNRNGVGQFGGEMKNALQRVCAPIEIPQPVFSKFEAQANISEMEASAFVASLPNIDIAYLDPPYNQHPYGSNYFMLNLILDYIKPENISRVSGIPSDWKRSDYNIRGKAAKALEAVMNKCPARILMISYNSEGFISFDEMMDMLEKMGTVTVFDQEYNTFRGCRNLSGRSTHVTEFLFKMERHD